MTVGGSFVMWRFVCDQTSWLSCWSVCDVVAASRSLEPLNVLPWKFCCLCPTCCSASGSHVYPQGGSALIFKRNPLLNEGDWSLLSLPWLTGSERSCSVPSPLSVWRLALVPTVFYALCLCCTMQLAASANHACCTSAPPLQMEVPLLRRHTQVRATASAHPCFSASSTFCKHSSFNQFKLIKLKAPQPPHRFALL